LGVIWDFALALNLDLALALDVDLDVALDFLEADFLLFLSSFFT
jgi:hypothetical protein